MMRRTAGQLLATVVMLAVLAFLGWVVVTAASPPAGAATVHSEHVSCWGAHPNAESGHICWEGALCIHYTDIEHGSQQIDNQCLTQGVHYTLQMNTTVDKANNNYSVILVGYVEDGPVHYWPFRRHEVDATFKGYPVVNIKWNPIPKPEHYWKNGECIVTHSIGADLFIYHAPDCSPVKQNGINTHDSYMVLEGDGHRIWEVALMNGTHEGRGTYCVTSLGIHETAVHSLPSNKGLNDLQLFYFHHLVR